jgi:homocysteine S-methyltransferase
MPLARSELARRLRGPAPLVLDGATGTELERRGVATRLPLWSAAALDTHPEVVAAIHADYVAAGADVLTANTFRTQRRSLAHAGWEGRARELTRRAVSLARDAADGRVLVFGSAVATILKLFSKSIPNQLVVSDIEEKIIESVFVPTA